MGKDGVTKDEVTMDAMSTLIENQREQEQRFFDMSIKHNKLMYQLKMYRDVTLIAIGLVIGIAIGVAFSKVTTSMSLVESKMLGGIVIKDQGYTLTPMVNTSTNVQPSKSEIIKK